MILNINIISRIFSISKLGGIIEISYFEKNPVIHVNSISS